MSMTAGPHLPKSGWLWRWTKQAAQLVFRSPETVLLSAVSGIALAVVYMAVTMTIEMVGVPLSMAKYIGSLAGVPVALFAIALIMNRIMIADLGDGWSIKEAYTIVRPILPRVMTYSVILTFISIFVDVFLLTPDVTGEAGAGARTQSEDGASIWFSLLVVMVYAGGAEIMTLFMPLALIHPFAVAALLGNRFTDEELRTNDLLLKAKSYPTHTKLLFAASMIPLSAILFVGFLIVLVIPLVIAWNYVGGREVVGGIDQNGKGQEETSFKTVSAGAL